MLGSAPVFFWASVCGCVCAAAADVIDDPSSMARITGQLAGEAVIGQNFVHGRAGRRDLPHGQEGRAAAKQEHQEGYEDER